MKPVRLSVHEPLRIENSVLSNKSNYTEELVPESGKFTNRKQLIGRPVSDLDLNYFVEKIPVVIRNKKNMRLVNLTPAEDNITADKPTIYLGGDSIESTYKPSQMRKSFKMGMCLHILSPHSKAKPII